MGAAWIVLILSFLSYALVHVSCNPNQAASDSKFNWFPKNSEDDVVDFRNPLDGTLPSIPEFDEESEYDVNEEDFDDEDDGNFELNHITNNKRSPNSASDRSFRNIAGYYLIEDSQHRIIGTPTKAVCDTNGVFRSGKTNGVPYIKNKKTDRYLAIDSSGRVYTTPNQGADTVIRTYVTPSFEVYLYRIVKNPKRYFYLDISAQGRSVLSTNLSNTSLFRIRLGKTC